MADEPDCLPPWMTWQQPPFLPRTECTSAPASCRWSSTPTGTPTTSEATRCCRPGEPGSPPASQTPDTVPAVTLRGCQAEYLDQPVTPYAVDEQLHESQILPLGDAQWQVIGTSGHTPGHLCLWQPHERPLIAGDSLPDDVGWVSTALDGPDAAATALSHAGNCA